jgi:hypothetical protein
MTVIDARDRFTKRANHQCRDCARPGVTFVLPRVDHRRRKPWPQPYWLCVAHTPETT